MINQHLQTARVPVEVSQQKFLEETILQAISRRVDATRIAELQDFIAQHPDGREVRKALAVKLVYQGYLYDEIQTILDEFSKPTPGAPLLGCSPAHIYPTF